MCLYACGCVIVCVCVYTCLNLFSRRSFHNKDTGFAIYFVRLFLGFHTRVSLTIPHAATYWQRYCAFQSLYYNHSQRTTTRPVRNGSEYGTLLLARLVNNTIRTFPLALLERYFSLLSVTSALLELVSF
jgi:hypothetical protein